MVYITICDDNFSFAQKAVNLIKSYIIESIQIEIVTDTALLKKIECGHIADIYFLDIGLPSISGMELAKKIRQIDEKVIIIFLTAYDQYVFESFQVNALRYLRKDRFEQEISEAIQAIYHKICKDKASHIFKTSRGEIKIQRTEIGYIQKINREIFLHKIDGESIKVQGTITLIATELLPFKFVQPNSGCIVNPEYIKGLLDTNVILEDGFKLPISRTRKKELRQTINAYWKESL